MIVIQAGHVDIEENIDGSLREETGAAGERELTAYVAHGVVDALQSNRVSAMYVDANFNGSPHAGAPYDAFVAVHFQSDTGEYDGFDVGTEDPETDGAAEKSAHLEDALADAYERRTGRMREMWCQKNPNVQSYYMWPSLAGETPCALIECGLADKIDKTPETGELDKIINGIVDGILGFLGEHQPDAIGHNPTAEALTNIGQAIVWIDASQGVLDQNTYKAINQALHAARKSLAGE